MYMNQSEPKTLRISKLEVKSLRQIVQDIVNYGQNTNITRPGPNNQQVSVWRHSPCLCPAPSSGDAVCHSGPMLHIILTHHSTAAPALHVLHTNHFNIIIDNKYVKFTLLQPSMQICIITYTDFGNIIVKVMMIQSCLIDSMDALTNKHNNLK